MTKEKVKQYKVIPEPKKCEHYRVYSRSIGYCLTKDIVCLCKKYGFENIKKYTVHGPYSDDVIYIYVMVNWRKNQNDRT